MEIPPRTMMGLPNSPSFRYKALNPAFQSDPRRILGQQLQQQGSSSAPVRTPLQGLGRLSSALIGAYLQKGAIDRQVAREDEYQNQLANALSGIDMSKTPILSGLSNVAPEVALPLAANMEITKATQKPAETFTTLSSTYEVKLNITGHTNSCNVQANYFYYEINYKFDNNDAIFNAGEGWEGTTHNHSEEGTILNNLEVTIHLNQFDPNNPSDEFKGAFLDNIKLAITNMESSEEVLNITLPSLFICTDVAYQNIINFNPVDNSYTVEQLTYGF